MKHTLFYLCAQLEILGKKNFKAWLARQGYTEAQVNEIRADMTKKSDYGKIYEARSMRDE